MRRKHQLPKIESLEPRLLMSRTVFADLFSSCQTLSVPAAGSLSISDQIRQQVAAKMYRFTTGAKGKLSVSMRSAGDGLDPVLRLFNDRGRRIKKNNNAAPGTTDSLLRYRMRPGRTYYLAAAAAAGTSGAYTLQINSDPRDRYGNTLQAATAGRISVRGGGWMADSIDYAGDVDVLRFTAPRTGQMRLSLSLPGLSNGLQAQLLAYTADGHLLGSTAAGQLDVHVVQGQDYCLKVAGLNGSTGRYRLRIFPTVLEILLAPEELTIQAGGSTSASGQLGVGGVKAYKFTAPARGRMRVGMSAGSGSAIDSYLLVFDGRGRLVGRSDNAAADSLDSQVSFTAWAGQTYYAVAAAINGTSGDYVLSLESIPADDYGGTLAQAGALALDADGSGSVTGWINYAGDTDALAVTATVTGTMEVSLAALGWLGGLRGVVGIYDADGELLAGGSGTSASVDVVSGETYYVLAAGADGTTGRYRLSVATEAEDLPAPTPPPTDPTPGQVVEVEVRSLTGGLQLLITGTDADDLITVSQSGASLVVTTAAGSDSYRGPFASVVVYGFGGDDVIRLAHSVSLTNWLYGGAGADELFEAGTGAGTLYGQDGDDLLVSVGGGVDALYGGAGLDSFWADSADGTGDASAAEAAARSVHKIEAFYQPYTTNPASSQYISTEIAGQDLPDPTTTSAAAGYRNFASTPLFVDGPQYDDIAQGSIGDCYFLAALSSLADTDPQVIQQMIAPLGDGTYAVRFYRDGEEVYLRIDADLPVRYSGSLAYAKLGRDGELWVPLAEKAYAYFRYDQNSYASLHGGWMSTVYREVTNMPSGFMWAYGSESGLWNFISRALAGGHAVSMGSYYNASGPIVGSHAYVVKSVENTEDGKFVTVYNPWGTDGRHVDPDPYDGLVKLTISEVQDYFMAVVTSAA